MLKDLKNKKEKQIKNILNPVEEAKNLLAWEEQEDLRIIREMCPNSVPASIANLEQKGIEMISYDKKFGGDTYNISQIQEVAVDYKLRFLQSKHFVGTFDRELTSKLKSYCKANNINSSSVNLQNSFYILAPDEMFSLNEKKYVTKAELRAQADPALFYHLGNGYYQLVHSWGKDLTLMRYIKAWKWRSYWHHIVVSMLMMMPVFGIIAGLVFPFGPISAIITGTLTCFTFCIGVLGKTDEGSIIKEYFTPHNFNSLDKLK